MFAVVHKNSCQPWPPHFCYDSRLLLVKIVFTLKAINLQTVRHREQPDCYDFTVIVCHLTLSLLLSTDWKISLYFMFLQQWRDTDLIAYCCLDRDSGNHVVTSWHGPKWTVKIKWVSSVNAVYPSTLSLSSQSNYEVDLSTQLWTMWSKCFFI